MSQSTEIDDIFAAKKKASSSSSSPLTVLRSPKQKDKKKRRNKTPTSSVPATQSLKRPATEIVVDTSSSRPAKKAKKPARSLDPDGKDFTNSRGSQARMSFRDFADAVSSVSGKTTEEGWSVYKEDELGIRDGGGGTPTIASLPNCHSTPPPDTPLCPFDCDCCMFETLLSVPPLTNHFLGF